MKGGEREETETQCPEGDICVRTTGQQNEFLIMIFTGNPGAVRASVSYIKNSDEHEMGRIRNNGSTERSL